jgi:glutathione reductase (NADPH)
VEWAQALARQGAQVTIVEAGDRLLPGYDPDCLPFLEKALSQEGIRVRCQTHVVKAIQRADKKIVQLRFDGWVEALETDEILLSEADPPQVSQFGLERLGLAFIEGCLVTDEWMRTNSRHIYAVGAGVFQRPDCGYWPEEVRKVTLNALLGMKLGIDYSSAPRVIKTEPELVAIGMSEKQAKTGGNGIRVWRGYLTPEGEWAEEASSAAGLVKLIADDHGTILGIHAVGMGVSSRIQGLREANRHKEKIFHLRRFRELLRRDPAPSRGVWRHSLRFRLEDWVEQGIRACVRLQK